MSIRVEPISKSAELRNRSAQTLTLLLTGLLAAALAAVILILGHEKGSYLVPVLIAVLVGGVANAWLIPMRLND